MFRKAPQLLKSISPIVEFISIEKNKFPNSLFYVTKNSTYLSYAPLNKFCKANYTQKVDLTSPYIDKINKTSNVNDSSEFPILSDMEEHFKMTTIRLALQKLPVKLSTNEFINYCMNILHSDEMTHVNVEEEAKHILKLLHDAGIIYWCQTSQQVWIATDLMRKRILENVFDQDVADAIINNNELLFEKYNTLKKELLPLHREYLRIYAEGRYRSDYWSFFGAGMLTFQGLVMAHMTWNLYGWDVIEPVTYFSGFSVAMGSFIFFTFWKKDYQYKTAKNLITDASVSKLLKKENFPIDTYKKLLQEWDELRSDVLKETNFMFGNKSQKLSNMLDITYLVREKLELENNSNKENV